jgi:hypothetical protein
MVNAEGGKFCERCGQRLTPAVGAGAPVPTEPLAAAAVASSEPAANDATPGSTTADSPAVSEAETSTTGAPVAAQNIAAPDASTLNYAPVDLEPAASSSIDATPETSADATAVSQPVVSAGGSDSSSIASPASPEIVSSRPSETAATAAVTPIAGQASSANAQPSCSSCGAVLPAQAKFCEKCGTRTPAAQGIAPVKNAPAWVPEPGSGKNYQIFESPQNTSRGPLMLIVILLVVLALAGLAAWKFFSGPDVAVTVAQPRVVAAPGERVSLLAAVTGSSDTDVIWSLKEGTRGGRLTPEGVLMVEGRVQSTAAYVAPQQPGTYHVTAASHANSNRKAGIEIVVGEGQNSGGQASSTAPVGTSSNPVVGVWQWPKPADDLRMEIAADGSVVIESALHPDNLRRGTYRITGGGKHLEIKMDDGETRKLDVQSIDGNTMRVLSESRDGVSAMTFTRVR